MPQVTHSQNVLVSCIDSLSLYKNNNKEYLSPDTILTRANIYQVLEYMGIDANNIIDTGTQGATEIITLKELEDSIQQFLKYNQESLEEFNNANKMNSLSIDPIDNHNNMITYGVRTDTGSLYLQTTETVYGMTRSCWGSYSRGSWTGATSGNVTGGYGWDVAGYKYQVEEIYSMNLVLQDSNKTIQMNSSYEVGGYIKVLGLGVKVMSNRVDSTDYYRISNYK